MDNPQPAPQKRRPLFLAGVLLFLLGPIAYIVQFQLSLLAVPWYLPILATVGVLLMARSLRQRGGILRSLGLILGVLICSGEWFMLVVVFQAPPYTGPIHPDDKVPAFTTTLADGSSFTDKDLANGHASVLLFFRGRW